MLASFNKLPISIISLGGRLLIKTIKKKKKKKEIRIRTIIVITITMINSRESTHS